MNRDKVEKLMQRCTMHYLDKYGTEGYKAFRQFMVDHDIPVSTLELVHERQEVVRHARTLNKAPLRPW